MNAAEFFLLMESLLAEVERTIEEVSGMCACARARTLPNLFGKKKKKKQLCSQRLVLAVGLK